jgi:hypothetical protein
VVFYGGFTGCTGGLGLTYTYSGGVFRNLTSTETVFPAAVEGSTQITYDTASDGVVLFSGYSVTCAVTNQTWLFHNDTWTNLTSVSGPPRRAAGTRDLPTTRPSGVPLPSVETRTPWEGRTP